MDRKIALQALRNLCTFIGAIALFSYFFNWAVDLRHWYVTLGSALACSILWLGFYLIEARGGVKQVAVELARSWPAAEEPPKSTPPLEPPTMVAEAAKQQADLPVPGVPDESEATAPNPLPWLRPAPPLKKAAGKP